MNGALANAVPHVDNNRLSLFRAALSYIQDQTAVTAQWLSELNLNIEKFDLSRLGQGVGMVSVLYKLESNAVPLVIKFSPFNGAETTAAGLVFCSSAFFGAVTPHRQRFRAARFARVRCNDTRVLFLQSCAAQAALRTVSHRSIFWTFLRSARARRVGNVVLEWLSSANEWTGVEKASNQRGATSRATFFFFFRV